MLKSIARMYSDELKSQPIPLDPLADARLRAELHLRFWFPIAQILDPNETRIGAPAQEFYAAGSRRCTLDDIKASLLLMRRYLGVDELPVGTWFRLRPIFGNLLADALIHEDMDVVACAVRDYVRLEAGQTPDGGYGLVEGESAIVEGQSIPSDRYKLQCKDDDDWFAYLEARSDMALGSFDHTRSMIVNGWYKIFDDPEAFQREFPGMSKHRLNMLRVLDPIFDLDWSSCSSLTEHAVRYARGLLAVDFKELTLRLKRNSVSSAYRDAA